MYLCIFVWWGKECFSLAVMVGWSLKKPSFMYNPGCILNFVFCTCGEHFLLREVFVDLLQSRLCS